MIIRLVVAFFHEDIIIIARDDGFLSVCDGVIYELPL